MPVVYAKDLPVTERQRRVWKWMRRYQAQFGWPPSIREVAEGLCMATNGAMTHIRQLVAKGWVVRHERGARKSRYVAVDPKSKGGGARPAAN